MDTNYICYSNHFPLYVSQAIISSVQLSCSVVSDSLPTATIKKIRTNKSWGGCGEKGTLLVGM